MFENLDETIKSKVKLLKFQNDQTYFPKQSRQQYNYTFGQVGKSVSFNIILFFYETL